MKRRLLGRVILLWLILAADLAFPGRAPKKVSREVEKVCERLKELVHQGATGLSSALRRYNSIEGSRLFDEFSRYKIHHSLLSEVRKVKDQRSVRVLLRALKYSTTVSFPAKVLAMKALLSNDFPLQKAEKVKLLSDLAREKDMRTFLWAVRLLGESRWPEAVDALITLFSELQSKGRKGFVRSCIVLMELYRVLGNKVTPTSTAAAIRMVWEKMGKKPPRSPDYAFSLSGSGRTVSFFGDIISPLSVFAIDHSTSMRQKVTLAYKGHGTTTKGKSDREPKVIVVKRELVRMIQSLREEYKFNILCYNAKVYPWRSLRLYSATSVNRASAELSLIHI